jgi:fructose-bisphosphate aldolase class I
MQRRCNDVNANDKHQRLPDVPPPNDCRPMRELQQIARSTRSSNVVFARSRSPPPQRARPSHTSLLTTFQPPRTPNDPKTLQAADESTGTVGKRLDSVGLPNTPENRVALRAMLFSSPGVSQHVSGAILFDETLKDAGLMAVLSKSGVIPGIKLDVGVAPLPGGGQGETYTMGLDGLAGRARDAYERGARFAKWRATLRVDASAGLPTDAALRHMATGLATYAAVSQQAGLVPIVEPELLADGPGAGQSMAAAERAARRTLAALFAELAAQGVSLEGALLKPSMVVAGAEHPERATTSADSVAEATLRVLRQTVPPALAGVVFLSGGQSEEEATRHLLRMNKIAAAKAAAGGAAAAGATTNGGGAGADADAAAASGRGAATAFKPWPLTFSYGRALQASALKAWAGKEGNVPAAQEAFLARARANGLAALGVE